MSKQQIHKYHINQKINILTHEDINFKNLYVKDEYGHVDPQEIEALVRSGQYFTTIATKLDKISLELKKENESQKNYLQIMVDELLYVQSQYKIKKKH